MLDHKACQLVATRLPTELTSGPEDGILSRRHKPVGPETHRVIAQAACCCIGWFQGHQAVLQEDAEQ